MSRPRSDHESVLLIQVSDSHLFGKQDGRLLGMNTAQSLRQVMNLVDREHPQIDLLLATGDLSQDGSLASYQLFQQLTADCKAPIRWIPGNHDETSAIHQATAGTELLNPLFDLGAWRIVLLDSSLPGSVSGLLSETQLSLLDEALHSAGNRHVLVALHHHPVPIGSQWMDRIGTANAAQLFQILEKHSQVRALLWGHVHQEFDQMRSQIRLLAAPSTCMQFAPGSEDFSIDQQAPGYRWLRLYADGSLETGVSRVTNVNFTVNFQAEGY